MEIRETEDVSMEIHTKKKMNLHIKKKSLIRTIKESNLPIVLNKQNLYRMGRQGTKKAVKELEGGEELEESAELISLALSPVYRGIKNVKKNYAKEKGSEQIKRNNKWKHHAGRYIDVPSNISRRSGRLASKDKQEEILEEQMQENKRIEKNLKVRKKSGGIKNNDDSETKKKNGNVKRYGRKKMIDLFRVRKEEKAESTETRHKTVRDRLDEAAQIIVVSLLPIILSVFALIAFVGVVVVLIMAVIYNSPFAIFFPLPDTGYDNPRTVLSSYYMEFNQQVMSIEENGDGITYQNTENGAPISNFNDTLMVYMVLYGDGKAGYVMDEEGKSNLKKVFDEMNYIDSTSSTVEKEVGDSISEVWVTAYCPCSLCCGPYANGITASGRTARAKHTIAVDAYNPIVPMGTQVVIEGITYTVEDTGDLNHYGNDFDIFYAHHQDTSEWGRRHVEAYLAEGNTNRVMVTTSGTTVHNLTYKDYINKNATNEEQNKMLESTMDSDLWNSYYSSSAGLTVAELAMTKIGCHYSQDRRYEEGYYDCSSLVYRLYKEIGIELPATASEQGKYCYKNAMIISKKDLKPGDLIFYSYKDNGEFRNISHVAIYVGDGMMVHAANESRGVVYDPLRDTHVVFYARPYN